ncbi:molybdenum cofactor biosynthesis moeA family protein [Mycobacterium kansasii 824]|nr:molybdenum cofactor biosynthesis moeA family protein [Mycobacterium kansasii 824]
MEEQQARISAAAVAPRPIRVAIAEAQGLMCAEEVVTERPLPGFDQAAIDGYAVRSVDVMGVGQDLGPGPPSSLPTTRASRVARW